MIGTALDEYLYATDDERLPDGHWHPSSMFQCDRQAAYNQRGTERSDPKGVGDHRPLVMGKLIHTLMQSAMSHQAEAENIVSAWHEVKVVIPDLKVKGSADSLLLLGDGTYELEEFKSTKLSSVKWTKKDDKGNRIPWQPKPEHVNQALTYVYGIRNHVWYTEHVDAEGDTFMVPHDPLGDKLSTARVVYITKDDFGIKEYLYTITPEWEEWFVGYMKKLHESEGGVLPARLPEKSWLCEGYCEWRTQCWGEDGP